METFAWNGTEGPAGKSFDLFGDGSLVLVLIPGHSDGLCVVRARNADGQFVLLFADGGYATRSWREMIPSDIATDQAAQRASLSWIRAQSQSPDCLESLATHDPAVVPHVITL